MRRCIQEASVDPGKSLDDFQNALTRFIGMS